ncbi:MAG: GUN4 N-terminal ARM-like repeat domain-containing protein [Cyanobacteria bacterium Co-bin13]|nr:GUN4 N-terminal ARM-like repeat domain-containing protein [Cyanobacteria bacterium Co-bin13]
MSSFTAHSSSPAASSGDALENLRQQLRAESLKKQLSAIHELVGIGDEGIELLQQVLLERQEQPPEILDGKIVQVLHATQKPEVHEFLQTHWPQGRVPMPSECGIDYSALQALLVAQSFEAADRLNMQKLCELAGPDAARRKWLYFTEVEQFPATDLQTLDTLWRLYSEGKFGFSRQREIWLGQGQNWDKLWTRIAWRNETTWTRYPNEFIWDLSAPDGHLPLSNQLRGVRVMASLLAHPAWPAGR